jgi:hypothetical protein
VAHLLRKGVTVGERLLQGRGQGLDGDDDPGKNRHQQDDAHRVGDVGAPFSATVGSVESRRHFVPLLAR